MARQILGHSIHQIAICFMITFGGDKIWGVPDAGLADRHANTVHYTLVFNAFVMMQLFNEINARKIHNELNVFKGLQNNPVFIAVWVFTLFGQVIIVEFGGSAFRTHPLTANQWLSCVGLGATSMIVNVLLHFFVPPTIFPERWFAPKVARPLAADEKSSSEPTEDPDESDLFLPRTETLPLEGVSRMTSARPARLLWHSVRRQLQVVSAFSSAGTRMRSRRLTLRDIAEQDLEKARALSATSRADPSQVTIDLDMMRPEAAKATSQTHLLTSSSNV